MQRYKTEELKHEINKVKHKKMFFSCFTDKYSISGSLICPKMCFFKYLYFECFHFRLFYIELNVYGTPEQSYVHFLCFLVIILK